MHVKNTCFTVYYDSNRKVQTPKSKHSRVFIVQLKRYPLGITTKTLWSPDGISTSLLQACQCMPFIFTAISLHITSTALHIKAPSNSRHVIEQNSKKKLKSSMGQRPFMRLWSSIHGQQPDTGQSCKTTDTGPVCHVLYFPAFIGTNLYS